MANVKKRNTYVYVVVDTKNIKVGDIDANVDLSDNWGGSYTIPNDPESFSSKIGMGKNITWCAIVKDAKKNPKDTVTINKISRKSDNGGAKILKQISDPTLDQSGVVIGKAKNSKVVGEENYYIIIEVNGKDKYTIDPKMRMP